MPEKIEAIPEHQMVTLLDLQMMVAEGGRERTEVEFRQLLHAAGFTITRIVPTSTAMSVIEACVDRSSC